MPDDSLTTAYRRDGFIFPLDVIGPAEARELLADLEAAEAALADDSDKLALLMAYPDRLLPSFDELTRHPALLAAVSQILGPDLMVWSAGLFSKAPASEKLVSWHQDLTYWDLSAADEVTAWVALSPSSEQSGCMMFIPGSHQRALVPHADTLNENNLLTRGQTITESIDETQSVAVCLEAGQASLHHGHLFHSSGPNRSTYRRVGSAIRYIKPAMQQRTGDRALVSLVSGVDRFDHFTVADVPAGRLHQDDFERCRRDAAIKRRVLYRGADALAGRRYT